jgi:hypothetical protein
MIGATSVKGSGGTGTAPRGKKLSTAAFNRAKRFLQTEARELERRLFAFHFGGDEGARGRVIEELERYQNPDGGFGRALEPDVRMQDSSVVATKFALQVLIDVQATAQEKLVRGGIAYLLCAFDKGRAVWPMVPQAVMDAPHAPWWNVEGLEREFGSYLANPKAGVVRCLLAYQELVPRDFIDDVLETLMEHLERLPTEMSLFDAMSFLLLLQSDHLDDGYRAKLRSKLEKTGQKIVASAPDEWLAFSAKPLWLAPSPEAPLAKVLERLVQENLDFEIEHQNRDGSWPPTWSWGNSYPESWKEAEREWRGVLTLAMLRSLRDYNRIEGCSPRLAGYKYHID